MFNLIKLLILVLFFASTSNGEFNFKLYTDSSNSSTSLTIETVVNDIKEYCNDSSCTNYIIIHGFQSKSTKWVNEMKNELFKNNNKTNVLTVDWKTGSIYINAVKKIANSANGVNDILKRLFRQGFFMVDDLKRMNIHCIGHSLGAHFCGKLGNLLQKDLGLKLMRITALDPAGPCFKNYDDYSRLDRNDADYVDVIHTSSVFGIQEPIGHSNYYPNGGKNQCEKSKKIFSGLGKKLTSGLLKFINLFSQCKEVDFEIDFGESRLIRHKRFLKGLAKGLIKDSYMCDHNKSYKYFIESIRNSSCRFMGFMGRECNKNGIKRDEENGSKHCMSNMMGFFSRKEATNGTHVYELDTNLNEPFCKLN